MLSIHVYAVVAGEAASTTTKRRQIRFLRLLPPHNTESIRCNLLRYGRRCADIVGGPTSCASNMSYHVFPQAGREAYNPRRKFAAMAKLEPLDGRPANYALMNTGWNESTLLPLDSSRHLLPPSRWNTNWETPTTNAFPMSATIKSDLSSSSFGRPFGSTSSSGVGGMRLALHKQKASIRTPLGAISRRSEHFYSNPIHGVFSEHVEEQPERWVTR